MSRRKSAVKRPVLPDARYDSQTVSKFINCMMYEGKKSTAERIFYGRWTSWRTARRSRA
jgi:small subunit ribosomal protein S7